VDTWTWEILPNPGPKNRAMVLVTESERWGRSFHDESVYQGVVFSPNFKFSYDFTPRGAGGLEYYGSVGAVTGFAAVSQQQHQIFPAIDLNVAPQWEINFGLGGLTARPSIILPR